MRRLLAVLVLCSLFASCTSVKGKPSEWRAFAKACVEELGPTLELDGPTNVSADGIASAYDDFMNGDRR